MYKSVYIEINILCLLILSYILYGCMRNIDKRQSKLLFTRVVYATMGILLLDIAWILLEGSPHPAARTANIIVNDWYMFQTAVISYTWLEYTLCKLRRSARYSKKQRLASLLPLLLLFLLCATSQWTKLIFYLDQNNVYHRGRLHVVQFAIAFGYLAAATLIVLKRLMRRHNRQERAELLTLLSFVALPGVAGFLQMFVEGIPAAWPATTLSLLMVSMNMQSYEISTDGLTGLNNRRQFDNYMAAALSDAKKAQDVYLFLMDIDSFKKINDTYGHVEGDNALVETAKLLRRACGNYSAFIARYGGDEFAAVYGCADRNEARAFKKAILEQFERRNSDNGSKYMLKLSIGYSCVKAGQTATATQLIAQADAALYEAKRRG